MKVSIIGGGGLVGSSAGFALQCGGVVREIALLDVNQELASGQALDLLHGAPSVADQVRRSASRLQPRAVAGACISQFSKADVPVVNRFAVTARTPARRPRRPEPL